MACSSSDPHKQQPHILSRRATDSSHGENSFYFDGWKAYDRDPYHPTRNPHGVIQMGLSENKLSFDLMENWVNNHPEASICTAQGLSKFVEVATFQDYHGLPAFCDAVAKFMAKARGGSVKFEPERIVMSGGATGANELIIFCLADAGDAFLVPTPYYPGFDRDLQWRTGVKLVPVHCNSSNAFKLTIPALEAAYQNAADGGLRVKGLIVTNPSNPLGTVLDKTTLKGLLAFATQKRIHLVCDEIYAATVSGCPGFVSVVEALQELPDCDRSLVHIVYSLSKDLGLPGFRVGIVYSYNDEVVSCGRRMSSFGLVSSQTQHLLASMLLDEEFVEAFMVETARRLLRRRRAFAQGLTEVGISCLEANAGLFTWMDLRPLLEENTGEKEAELWRVIVDDVKLNISPGSSFHCSEPGWYRVCFANMDDTTMEEALRRIGCFVRRSHKAGQPVRLMSNTLPLSLPLPLPLSYSQSGL